MESNRSTPWAKIPLGEVTEEIRDRVNHPDGDGLAVYGVERQDDFMVTPKYSAENLSRYKKIRPGNFAYNPMRLNIGSIGMCGFHQAPGLISPDYIGFRCIDKKLHPSFLRHVIKGPEWINWTESAGVGSVRQRIYYKEIAKLALTIPLFKEQKAIAKTLDAIDVLIDLNARTNAIIEEMARTLFRSWLVAFDPVHAKTEGRQPEGMDAETAELFPSEFVESELGMIPKGWKIGSIYEIADVIYGAPFASSAFNSDKNGKKIIRIRDLSDETPKIWTPEIHPKGYTVIPGDIVVGMDGEFKAYIWGGPEAWLNQRVCVFSPKPTYSHAFVRNSIIDPLHQVESTEIATTVIHLGKNDIDRFNVVIPSVDVVNAFNNLCQPWYDCIVANKLESKKLVALREELLPKLISGEVRLPTEIVAEFASDEVNA